MNNYLNISLVTLFCLLLCSVVPTHVGAVSRRAMPQTTATWQREISIEKKETTNIRKREKLKARWKGWKAGWHKKISQFRQWLAVRGSAATYLKICIGLLLVTIILFIISGAVIYSNLFSILGSVAFLGATVFFVLWLLAFTGK